MKKWIAAVLFLPLFFACKKNDSCSYTETNATASAAEVTYLQDYLASNSITATQHATGMFYHIDNPGTGAAPSICSNITVTYNGFLLSNGSQFAAETNANYALGQLIKGWQKGLPLIRKGGSISLFIPPTLAYGANDVSQNGAVVIPGNSYLRFNIQLLDVQ